MYCIKCGVKLAETEKKCPLCETIVCRPDFGFSQEIPQYPINKMPKSAYGLKALGGVFIILFFIPLIVSLFSDIHTNGRLDWFGLVAGGLTVGYIIFILPLWFKKPNPVIFAPCNFFGIAIYLLYINLKTNGNWYLSFALPIVFGIGLITCTIITLIFYIKKGKLYIWGGASVLFGGFVLLIEYLLTVTFDVKFIGWSFYPLIVLTLFGGLLIYLAIDSNARETIERKFFF